MVQRLLFGVLLVVLGIGLIVWSVIRGSTDQLMPDVPATSDGDVACIQVLTDAKDPATGEVRTFPTPCDVPEGWEVLVPTSE